MTSRNIWGMPRLVPMQEYGICAVYNRKGREPPPDLIGWKRLPDNKWAFSHDFGVKCSGMLNMLQKECCGVYAIATICNKDGSPFRSSPVTPAVCQSCQFRQGIDAPGVAQVLPLDYSTNQELAADFIND